MNTFQLLERAAASAPASIAVIVGRRAEEATYGQLLARSLGFAAELSELGLKSDDRVALWHNNSVDWIVAAMAIARLGCVVAPINTRWTLYEVSQTLETVQPRLMIAGATHLASDGTRGKEVPEGHPGLSGILRDLRCLVIDDGGAQGDGASPWMECVSNIPAGQLGTGDHDTSNLPPMDLVTREPIVGHSAFCDRSVGAILTTSGTTSKPKAVMLHHASLVRLARCIAQRQDLTSGDRLYTIAPFHHCSGLVHGIFTAFAARCRLYATAKYRAEETESTLRSERITSYHGFALPLKEAAALPHFDPTEHNSLRGAWFSAPAGDMADLEDRYGAMMCELYGLTESSGNSVMTSLDDDRKVRHETDGYPHDGIEVGVFDLARDARVGIGQVGEIRIRGWNVMRGYFGETEATSRAIDDEGWLHTGDAGVMDSAGNLTFLARLDDVIRVGGENVNPAEVEEVLAGHPDVEEAAVVGVHHPRLDQVPVAFVVLRKGADCGQSELTELCERHLAKFKVPREVLFVDSLPKTDATIRLKRSAVKDLYRLPEEQGH